ncbi:A-kinase anchor protein 14-like isoform X2 [Apostichopus japonicus]|uniref:A-kinase anchor protein 14-like isoform X2 n=1 Tax=Stichopus japonicus TaxID=307972 RepID=UPI003AB41E09
MGQKTILELFYPHAQTRFMMPGSDENDVQDQAHALIDQVINNARKRVLHELGNVDGEPVSRPVSSVKSYDGILCRETEEHTISNIEWLKIDEFTIEKATQKIEEFVNTWEFEEAWLHCIDFLREEEDEYSKIYRYQVRWSIPTRRKPIPRATACVYFTIEVSKIRPGSYPVEVYYVFETNRLVHKPGESRFREAWLKNIIENKIMMMEAIKF